MTAILKVMLVLHVFAGLAGVMASYAVWMGFLKKNLSWQFLRGAALVALLGYILSWISGGYYYLTHYGSSVRPVILAGDYAWAHRVVMEAKEHVFLFLPFLSLAILLCVWFEADEIEKNLALKKSLTRLSALTFFLGALIALAGVIISGAAR